MLSLLDDGSASAVDFSTDNAYDCCVACFQTAYCFGSNYGAQYGANSCELEVGTTCPASQGGFGGDYSNGADPAYALTFSNGPCGTYVYHAS